MLPIWRESDWNRPTALSQKRPILRCSSNHPSPDAGAQSRDLQTAASLVRMKQTKSICQRWYGQMVRSSSVAPNSSDAQIVGAPRLAERDAGNNHHTVTLARKNLLLHDRLSDCDHFLVGMYICRLHAVRTP